MEDDKLRRVLINGFFRTYIGVLFDVEKAEDDSEPVAYVEVSIFGNEDHIGYDRLTVEITRMFHDILKIASDHVHVWYCLGSGTDWMRNLVVKDSGGKLHVLCTPAEAVS